MAAKDPSPIASVLSPLLVIGWVVYSMSRRRAEREPAAPGRTLGELMDAADRLERERAAHPWRFALRGWWLAFRGHLEPGIVLYLALGAFFAAIAVGNWVEMVRMEPGAASVLTPLLPLAILGAALWSIGTGRFKLRLQSATLLVFACIGLMIITIVLGDLTGLSKAAGERLGLTALAMLLTHGMLAGVAARLPGILGLDKGVVGKALDVTPSSSPRLHALVRETAASLGLPVPSRILVAEQTSLAQHIQLQSAEGDVTELRMGINELLELDADELRAVIAHELEHQRHRSLCQRALFSAIGRLRAGKLSAPRLRLVEEMELHACVVLRENERLSDRTSAKVDAARAASALTRIVVRGIANDTAFAQADRFISLAPEPPATVEALNALIESQPWYPEVLRTSRAVALLSVTLPGSTHPMLGDRLRGMGQPAPAELPRPATTAAALLDDAGADFLRRHHENWRVKNREAWMAAHARLKADEALLQDPDNARLESLNNVQLRKRAADLWLLRGMEAALPALEAYRARLPEDTWAVYWTARVKSELGMEEGAAELVALARRDPGQADALRYAAIHAFLKGREDEARGLWRDMLRLGDVETRNKTERETVTDAAEALPHAIGEPELPVLIGTLADHGVIRSAHLVRRKLTHNPKPDQHLIVLAFWNGPDGRYERGHEEHRKEATQAVLKIFQDTKHEFWVLPAEGFPLYAKAAKAIPGSQLK